MVGGEREGDSWAWFVFSEGLSGLNSIVPCAPLTLFGTAEKEIRQFCQIRLPSPASLGWNAAALTSRIDSAAVFRANLLTTHALDRTIAKRRR